VAVPCGARPCLAQDRGDAGASRRPEAGAWRGRPARPWVPGGVGGRFRPRARPAGRGCSGTVRDLPRALLDAGRHRRRVPRRVAGGRPREGPWWRPARAARPVAVAHPQGRQGLRVGAFGFRRWSRQQGRRRRRRAGGAHRPGAGCRCRRRVRGGVGRWGRPGDRTARGRVGDPRPRWAGTGRSAGLPCAARRQRRSRSGGVPAARLPGIAPAPAQLAPHRPRGTGVRTAARRRAGHRAAGTAGRRHPARCR
jgi:hypothetical protein